MTEIKGYRILSDEEKSYVNRNKRLEETILRMIDSMGRDSSIEKRWLAIARTHIEEGFMALNRSIMKPERVSLEDD